MKPAPFDYHAPSTVADACSLYSELGAGTWLLAGGQSLVPMMAARRIRPRALIDLNRVTGMAGIETNGTITIGALTRQHVIERSAEVRRLVPVLAQAAALTGHPQVRNRGTLGGSLVHAHPAAELPAAALVLDATVSAQRASGERRTIAIADLYRADSILYQDEIVTAVSFPVPPKRSGYAIQEVTRRGRDFAIVGAAAMVAHDGSDVRVAILGGAARPSRAHAVENALRGQPLTVERIREAVTRLSVDPPEDVHVSTAYRQRVAATVVERVLVEATERGGGR